MGDRNVWLTTHIWGTEFPESSSYPVLKKLFVKIKDELTSLFESYNFSLLIHFDIFGEYCNHKVKSGLNRIEIRKSQIYISFGIGRSDYFASVSDFEKFLACCFGILGSKLEQRIYKLQSDDKRAELLKRLAVYVLKLSEQLSK